MASVSARRYARAIFEVAAQEGSEAAWTERLAVLREVLERPDVQQVVANPSIAPSRRLEAVEAVLGEHVDGEALNLAKMLVAGRHAGAVGEIAGEYEALVDQAADQVRAIATTAIELPDQERERLVKGLSARLGKTVRLELRVDPGILGGLVLEVGGRVADASVATRLEQLRRRLAAT